jgi:predicted GH43/DUF377 family glycosyl hydrolase
MNIASLNTILLISFLIALIAILLYFWKQRNIKETLERFHINRHSKNPILCPIHHNDWEGAGAFNPAVVTDDQGNVHMVYRALGHDGMSKIGYAKSKDGINFDERLPYPVYIMENPRKVDKEKMRPDPVMYPSGGSWGGCEDPRLVRIDGQIYMTFNAFDGWDFIRIGVAKINERDFFNQRFDWKKLLFISPQGEVNKNWVLFPEKINGKFAILHGITPKVQIDFVDRLEQLSTGHTKIKSIYSQNKDIQSWEEFIRGAGPPPIKTEKGWLVLYHAHKKNEMNKYSLGAMILDLHDPTKVIAKAPMPILNPQEWYENDWKPGVIYACGAVIKDDRLIVYYGGGDKYVCIGETNIHELLEWIINNNAIKN